MAILARAASSDWYIETVLLAVNESFASLLSSIIFIYLLLVLLDINFSKNNILILFLCSSSVQICSSRLSYVDCGGFKM